MMKLLFKPTGNIFTLPDNEALAIKASDRGNYEVLDAGLNEPEPTITISQEEVKQVLEAKAEKIARDDKAIAEKETKKANKNKKRVNPIFRKFDMSNLEALEKDVLETLAGKLGITDPHNKKKSELIRRIRELRGE